MDRVRRLAIAILLALLIAALTVAAAGFQEKSEDGPTTLSLPPHRAGDAGRYVDEEGDEFRFEYVVDEWWGSDGSEQEVLRLGLDALHITDTTQVWLDQDLDPLGATDKTWGIGSGSGFFVSGTGMISGAQSLAFMDHYGPGDPVCGVLASEPLTLDVPAYLPGCGEIEAVGPLVNGTHTFAGTDVEVTFDERFPVATRIVVDNETWMLTDFERGEDLPSWEEPSGPVPVTMAPGPRGPDETGIDHPFPLSYALWYALDIEPTNPLRTFQDKHPDAYVAYADFLEVLKPGTRAYIWNVTLTDGQDAVSATLTENTAQADQENVGTPTSAVGTGLVLPAPPLPVIEEIPAPTGPFLPPDHIPDLPTLASMADRWVDQYGEKPGAENVQSWGFELTCGATCDEADGEVWVGRNITEHLDHQDSTPCIIVCDNYREIHKVSRVHVGLDGLTRSHEWTDWVIYYSATYNDPSNILVEDGRDESPPEKEETVQAGIGWGIPSTPTTVGLSLAGMLAGALYYFWPALKSGVFAGLVRGEPRFDHPRRAALYASIHAHPGIHQRALGREVGIGPGALRHHLGVLESQGLVTHRDQGGYQCYFLARGTDRRVLAAAGALRSAGARRILEASLAGPASIGEAARLAGMTASTASHHVRRLESAGLVERVQEGRSVFLHATPLAHRVAAAT